MAESWTPSDIALVVSTSATALAAVGATLVPVIRDWLQRNSERRFGAYSELKKQILELVSSIDRALLYLDNAKMTMAYSDAGILNKAFINKDDRGDFDTFNANARLVEALALEIGLDVEDFNQAVSTYRTCSVPYEIIDDKLSKASNYEQVLEERVKAANEIVASCADLLKRAASS